MPDTIEDIVSQARQGSMAAIIQVLNEQLAERGVRTRAILQEGVLQVLCEAPTAEPLARDTLLPRVREILEAIEPRKLRRARISSRIAREQQVIWLEDIHRNPDSQLLWSEAIVLRRPNILQRLSRLGQRSRARGESRIPLLPPANIVKKPKSQAPEELTFWRGLLGGLLLSALSFLLGWGYQYWRSQGLTVAPLANLLAPESPEASPASAPSPTPAATASPAATPSPSPSPTPTATPAPTPTTVVVPPAASSPTPTPAASPLPDDPFAAAVRLAEDGAARGQTASTAEQWQDLANQWQTAAELMRAVPADDARYDTARDRSQRYQDNSELARAQAAAIAAQ